jgi:predicted dehydrogenase
MNRRKFLKTAAAGGASLAFPSILPAASPNSRLRVAVVGVSRTTAGGNGRGCELALTLARLPNVEITHLCDVYEPHLLKALKVVTEETGQKPKGEHDFRRLLDEKELDAMVIATPNHWQAPAAILACAAGKHVYLETPGSHTPDEGHALAVAARKYGRVVQHGGQRRSWPAIREAVGRIQEGAIGRVMLAQALSYDNRPGIAHGDVAAPPAGLDWALWQGPAPERKFRDNYFPYNWRWFWHWGDGELGVSGVHLIDICRWGLRASFPERVVSGGQKLAYSDDQETPDTQTATFDFTGDAPATLTWECRSWNARTPNDPKYDVAFFGEGGALYIRGSGYVLADPNGREVSRGAGAAGVELHLQKFTDAVRGSASIEGDLDEWTVSALLCHLGNISWRTRRAIHFDPVLRLIADDPEAAKLWRREYQPGFEPKG